MSDTDGARRIDRDHVLEIIDEVENKVLDEDKMGASRDQIAAGTCARIRRRLRSVDRGTDRGDST